MVYIIRMSRSYRKFPFAGGQCGQHEWKKKSNRKHRRIARMYLTLEDYLSILALHPKLFGNEWDSPRDGNHNLLGCVDEGKRHWRRWKR